MSAAQLIITAVDQTQAAVRSAIGGMSRLQSETTRLQGALNTIGAGVGVGALMALARSAIEAGDAMAKLSKQSGLSVATLSALKFAADQSETSIEELAKGIRFLSRNAVESAKDFEAIAVATRDSQGNLRKVDEVLLDVADRFARMPDGIEKTELAMRLFGKSGADLIPFLNQGRAGIQELMQEAQRLGVVMSEDFAKAADSFNDNMAKVKAGGASLLQGVIAPAVEGWSQIIDVLNRVRAGQSISEAIGNVADAKRTADTISDLVAQPGRIAEASAAAARARLDSQSETGRQLIAMLQRETTHVRATLAAQVAAYKEATQQVAEARKQRNQIESDNAAFLTRLRAGPGARGEEASPLDVVALNAQARQALDSGDAAKAIQLGQEAKRLIDDIVASGARSAGYMESFATQVVALQNAAAAAQEAQAQARMADIQRVFSETLVKAEALKKLQIGFDLPDAQKRLDDLMAIMQAQLAGKPLVVPLVLPSDDALKAAAINAPGKAAGGLLSGPGTDTSDNLLAWLSPGEYVVRAAAVRHYGAGLLSAINSLQVPKFAGGGAVSSQTINLSWPGGGPFEVSASPEIAGQMVSLFQREALKRGRRL